MKNIFALLAAVFVLATGCCSKKKAAEAAANNVSFEYETTTRGAYHKVIAKKDTLTFIDGRNRNITSKVVLPEAEWNQLTEAYKTVKPEAMADLKSPTTKRFYDGAAIATLTVVKEGNTFKSADFDNGFPPQEIKPLTDLIVALAAKYKKSDEN